MNYVYLTGDVVTDQAQVDPFTIFAPGYAEGFIEAPDDVTIGWTYEDERFFPPPGPTPQEIQAQNKSQAILKLQETDWAATVDITDPAYSDPYLENQTDFLRYRSSVRKIAVNPPATPVTDWPVEPDAIWEPAQAVL